MSKYLLTDVESRHAEYPKTFWIPPLTERLALKKGDTVKLVFTLSIADMSRHPDVFKRLDSERMWVIVTAVDEAEDRDLRYTGKLVNHPAVVTLKYGDIIKFGPQHIADITHAKTVSTKADRAKVGSTKRAPCS